MTAPATPRTTIMDVPGKPYPTIVLGPADCHRCGERLYWTGVLWTTDPIFASDPEPREGDLGLLQHRCAV